MGTYLLMGSYFFIIIFKIFEIYLFIIIIIIIILKKNPNVTEKTISRTL